MFVFLDIAVAILAISLFALGWELSWLRSSKQTIEILEENIALHDEIIKLLDENIALRDEKIELLDENIELQNENLALLKKLGSKRKK